MEKIRVYTIPNCPYCTELKGLLTSSNIEFDDININLPENEKEYQQIYELSKAEEVPIVKVGKQLLIPNISFKSIKEASEIVKNLLG